MSLLSVGSSVSLAVSVGLSVAKLAAIPSSPSPRFGHRGEARLRALENSALLAASEPVVRWFAGIAARLPLDALRASQERELRRADYCLGMTADEYSALSVLSALVLASAGLFIVHATASSPVLVVSLAVLGLFLPALQIREIRRRRAKEITRGLPHSIEIVSMCMGAGLDLVGALRLVSQPKNGLRDALARELFLILEELEFGRTRREAFLAFAERVPTRAVRDLALAVVQAEQKGNPLAQVIRLQGRSLNLRRSTEAEEAAARAGVLMVFPMMLLLGTILLFLVGPLVAKGVAF